MESLCELRNEGWKPGRKWWAAQESGRCQGDDVSAWGLRAPQATPALPGIHVRSHQRGTQVYGRLRRKRRGRTPGKQTTQLHPHGSSRRRPVGSLPSC